MHKTGFVDIQRGAEVPYGIDECTQYPLFTPELIALMRRLIPPARHATVARSLVFTAHKPGGGSPHEG